MGGVEPVDAKEVVVVEDVLGKFVELVVAV